MKYEKIKKMHVYTFNSISEYGDWIKQQHEAGKYWEGSRRSSDAARGNDWATDTLDQAIERACNGGFWEEGAEKMAAVNASGLVGQLADGSETELGVMGGAVDTGEYLADSPECFYQLQEVERQRPIVKIGYMPVPCARTDAKQVFNRGRAVMALIDAMERAGYSVQLDIVDSFKRTNSEAYPEMRCTIKHAGENWSAGSVAYAMANSSFSRRLGFRFAEASEAGAPTKSNYGSGKELSKWEARALADYDITFGYLIDDNAEGNAMWSEETALQYVMRRAENCMADLKLAA